MLLDVVCRHLYAPLDSFSQLWSSSFPPRRGLPLGACASVANLRSLSDSSLRQQSLVSVIRSPLCVHTVSLKYTFHAHIRACKVSKRMIGWFFSPPRATRASSWLNKRPAYRVVTESRSQRATCDAVPNMVLQTRLSIRPLLTASSLNNFSRMAHRQHPRGSVDPTASRGHGASPALTQQQIERQGWLTTAEAYRGLYQPPKPAGSSSTSATASGPPPSAPSSAPPLAASSGKNPAAFSGHSSANSQPLDVRWA
ncbi:hypothetical protein BD626DRAFT_581829, partial [Schizophyllum amplum]